MGWTRRITLTIGGAALLQACLPTRGPSNRSTQSQQDPTLRPVPNAAYDAWLSAFRPRARAQGITQTTLDLGLQNAGFLPGVIERDRNQTETTRTTEDYLAIVASEEDVTLGRAQFRAARGTLNAIAAQYGVAAEILAAIWGVESRYGTRLGTIPVISATSTLAFDGQRGQFFEAQLIDALRILQRGDTTPSNLTGSWAGAMGHTQFIPTTYAAYAVDFNGDGRRDVWSNDPTDALASTANYLARSGWHRGQPWGLEVRLPAGFNTAQAGRGRWRSVTEWGTLGVQAATGGPLPDYGAAAILAPGGAGGPGFAVFHNFDVILRYNASTNYGIGVGYLADRIAGAGPLRGQFGPDATGLTQADRREIQNRLNRAGFDTGTPDGVIGDRTEAAIAAFERARGLPVTGRASPELLARLR